MTLNFPANPNNGDRYVNWIWDGPGNKWRLAPIAGWDAPHDNWVYLRINGAWERFGYVEP